jgi:hypothetical protein
LCVNFPGLAQWLLDREAEGMAFRVTRGRDKIRRPRRRARILAGIALVALAIVAGPAA